MRTRPRGKAAPDIVLLVTALLGIGAPEPMAAPDRTGTGDENRPNHPIIATIRIDRDDVFDLANPDERHLPYIWANKLHFETREYIIRRELLFEEGDPADPHVLYESERNLRRLTFLHDNSRIETVPRDGGRVDVVVHTRDVWTTRPSVSINREGNETTGRFSFSEQNMFGFGKSLGLSLKKELDRDSGGIEYSDPRLLGTRWNLNASYFDRSDGILYSARADRPFFSVSTVQAGGGGGSHFSQVTTLQIDGDDAPGFRQRQSHLQLRYGRALRAGYEGVRRLVGRFRLEDDRFDCEPGEAPFPGCPGSGPAPPPLPPVGGSGYVALPENRRFRILEVEYLSSDVRFERVSYLDMFDRLQDIDLGNDWAASIGVSPQFLGDEHNHLFIAGRYGRWFHLSPATYTRVDGSTSGRLLAGVGRNVVTEFDFRHYYLGFPRQTLVFHADHSWGHNLDGDKQFLLGGDTGLRGYDNRRFDGNKRLLLNVEDRAYIVFDWLHLLSVAFSAFGDAGYVWRAGESEDLGDVVGDAGIGFRFDVTRGSSGTVIRLDYAYPLNGGGREDNRRGLLSFTAGQAF